MDSTISQYLRRELKQRKLRNPRYSIRAFARYLQIGKTSLADFMANKRNLSRKSIQKILQRINYKTNGE